jgi:yeast amino acid transporter
MLYRALNGHSVDELPFRAAFGVWGSYVCAIMNFVFCVAQFYVALYPVGGPNLNVENFFELYLAGPFVIGLYIIWKVYSWFAVPAHRPLYIKIKDIDIYSGMREGQADFISGRNVTEDQRRQSIQEMREENKKQGVGGWAKATVRTLF